MRAQPHDDRKTKFLSLFRSNMNAVFGFACRMLNDHHAAEDATQEVFLRLYQSVLDGTDHRNPRSWLMVVTRNLCLNRLRETRRVVSLESLDREPRRGDDNRIEARRRLDTALGQLDVRQREALILREFEGFSYAEIANMTDTTTAGVRSLLYRARVELRDILEKTPEWR
jgi:RNA polymerase sigma-70 factor (ECF subfamily)